LHYSNANQKEFAMNSATHFASTFASTRQSKRGFTLIEVMITIVIISLLAAVALPAYKNYMITGKIPLALSGLAAEQSAMEQYFQDHQTYVGAPGCTSAGNGSTAQYFTFTCSSTPTATAYTLQAAGVGSMSAFTYSVDQSGNKLTTLNSPPSGWTGSGNTCWVNRTGGKC
jgi:type IV pilus assembly protein PilE